MTPGHDDPLETMSLDEILAAHPVDPTILASPGETLARLKGLASEAEREWFRGRVLGDFPAIAGGAMADGFVALCTGLAVNARENGVPFRLVAESMARCYGWKPDDEPDALASRALILDAMEVMSRPGWSPR